MAFKRRSSRVAINMIATSSRSLKPRILVVDDHERVRAGIAALLAGFGEICGEASNGIEAIEKVQELYPDLVLLDLSMPLMGGSEAAKTIRTVAPAVKIVLISVNDSSRAAQLMRSVGADGFVSKGCKADLLRQTIASILHIPA